MGIETICEAGTGGSATVLVQLRDSIPGLGGQVSTNQDFTVALRKPREVSPYMINNSYDLDWKEPKSISALRLFLKHALIKKFDDFFFRTQKYSFAHIPRPLGSDGKGSYFYEFVKGSEGFYTQYFDQETYNWHDILVDEWNTFVGHYTGVGIEMKQDIADPEDGRYTKNLILSTHSHLSEDRISKFWKRIDFGNESLNVDYDKVLTYMERHDSDMREVLRADRIEMMNLIAEFLNIHKHPEKFKSLDRLTDLVKSYRLSTASHMGVELVSPPPTLKTGKEIIMLPGNLGPDNYVSSTKVIKETDHSLLELEGRTGFESLDGIIYTYQEIPTAKYTALDNGARDSGLKMFLRHFIIKKLENAFIEWGDYSIAHISRPVGSLDNSYLYEWAEGTSRCPRKHAERGLPSNNVEGLHDWHEFTEFFKEAGIDFTKGLSYHLEGGKECVDQIVVSQPYTLNEDNYISRMWNWVNVTERNTHIDYDKLQQYLIRKEDQLRNSLTPGRYETMVLALKCLKGEIENGERKELKNLIHEYRVSALRHLNYKGFETPKTGTADLQVQG